VTSSLLIKVSPSCLLFDSRNEKVHLLLYGVQNTPHILVNLQALQQSSFTRKEKNQTLNLMLEYHKRGMEEGQVSDEISRLASTNLLSLTHNLGMIWGKQF